MTEILNEQFQSVFVDEPAAELPVFNSRTDQILDGNKFRRTITEERILELLKGLDETKAMGFDQLHPMVLKRAALGFALPLKLIFELSYESSIVPHHWTLANVTPIHKCGSKQDPANYIPVSLTSVACKMFEKLLRDIVVDYLLTNKLICDEQTGFVPKKSCLTNLLETLDHITYEAAKGKPLCVVYLDFAKAFDKVPHKRLLLKLQAYGIKGKCLEWVKSFLSNRLQRVALGDKVSSW